MVSDVHTTCATQPQLQPPVLPPLYNLISYCSFLFFSLHNLREALRCHSTAPQSLANAPPSLRILARHNHPQDPNGGGRPAGPWSVPTPGLKSYRQPSQPGQGRNPSSPPLPPTHTYLKPHFTLILTFATHPNTQRTLYPFHTKIKVILYKFHTKSKPPQSDLVINPSTPTLTLCTMYQRQTPTQFTVIPTSQP